MYFLFCFKIKKLGKPPRISINLINQAEDEDDDEKYEEEEEFS